jgi:hypothetical protein
MKINLILFIGLLPLHAFTQQNNLLVDSLVRYGFFNELRDTANNLIQNPDWHTMEKFLADRYNKDLARKVILKEKIAYYHTKEDYNKQAKFELEQVKLYGLDTSNDQKLVMVNDMIWNEIFSRKVSRRITKRATRYLKTIVKARPDNYHFIDTYANLLFKLGYARAAAKEERKALLLAEKNNDSEINYYQQTFDKMSQSTPKNNQQ